MNAQAERGGSDRILLLLSICAAVVASLAVRHEFFVSGPGPAIVPLEAAKTLPPADWAELVASGHRIGSESAEDVVLVFSDFECPVCRSFARTFAGIERAPGRSVAMVFHHLPLAAIHEHAVEAAVASECAAQLGAFPTFHDYLFENQGDLGDDPWRKAATAAGIPHGVEFTQCLADDEPRRRVAADQARAERLGLSATPAVWFNGRQLNRAPDSLELHRLVGRR